MLILLLLFSFYIPSRCESTTYTALSEACHLLLMIKLFYLSTSINTLKDLSDTFHFRIRPNHMCVYMNCGHLWSFKDKTTQYQLEEDKKLRQTHKRHLWVIKDVHSSDDKIKSSLSSNVIVGCVCVCVIHGRHT